MLTSTRSSRSCSVWSACPRRYTHLSSGTPSRRAADTDITSAAAPWLTVSRATSSRGYGSQIIRFSSVTVSISSTERSTGDDENGFLAATFENGANSSAIAWR